jgi:hypothetical protein
MKMKMTKTRIWNNIMKDNNTMITIFGLLIKHDLVIMKTNITKTMVWKNMIKSIIITALFHHNLTLDDQDHDLEDKNQEVQHHG